MFRTPRASPISTSDFGTPLAGFDLPCYAHDMAIDMAEAVSPPSRMPKPSYNRRVLGLLDLEAKEGNEFVKD